MSTAVATPTPSRSRRPRMPAFVAHDRGGKVGFVFLAVIVLIAIFGPLIAPHSPDQTIGIPGQGSTGGSLLGLDQVGRDVLSRALSGGRSALILGALATIATYLVGIVLGLIAGYARNTPLDGITMRTVDVFISMPAILVMLVLVTALGGASWVLVLGAAIVLFPGVTRIVRTAAAETATRGYVEAAVARGEKRRAIMGREILPNIMAPIIADLGVRFSWSIILIASVNFLGLGLSPPASDWGLMISENRGIIPTNPWGVVAPALALVILILGVNLLGDAYVRHLGRSSER